MKKPSPLLIFYLPMTNDKAIDFTICDPQMKIISLFLAKVQNKAYLCCRFVNSRNETDLNIHYG